METFGIPYTRLGIKRELYVCMCQFIQLGYIHTRVLSKKKTICVCPQRLRQKHSAIGVSGLRPPTLRDLPSVGQRKYISYPTV
jgi:hypothetical protein